MSRFHLLNRSSFRQKIIVLFVLLILAPFLFFAYFSNQQSVKSISEANQSFYLAYLMQSRKNFEIYLKDLNNTINDIIGEKQLQRMLDAKPQSQEEEGKIAIEMMNFISQKQLTISTINAFRLRIYPVHPENFPTYISNLDDPPNLAEQAWFKEEIAYAKPAWKLFFPKDYPSFFPAPVLTRLKLFTGLYDKEPRGIIAVDLLEDELYRFVTSPQQLEGQQTFIIDLDGNILSHTDKNAIGTSISSPEILKLADRNSEGTEIIDFHKRKTLITYARLSREPWVMVSAIPLDTLLKPIQKVNKLTVVLIACYVLCCIGVIVYLTLYVTNPVIRLVRSMKRLEKGDFHTSVAPSKRADEMGLLHNGFIHMTRKMEILIQEVYQSEKAKKELEFQVLSHQINPHFLYNTLESIRWKAETHKMPEISKMVAALGNLLRLSLNQGKELTTVSREVEHVKAYVHIESARIDRPLRVAFMIEDEILELPLLRLLLQPLVENAIHHGIRDIEDRGKIALTGKRVDQMLIFELSDNGCGIPEEILITFRNGTLKEEEQQGSQLRRGVGLWNVHQRLKLYFGEAYGLSIVSSPQSGTRITIRHPVIQPDPDRK